MSELWRLLGLFRPYSGWIVLGVLASLATLIANVTLMAVSGWFIASMAIAGATQTSLNYFTPAAMIRACAIVRTGGRYGERLVTHEATLRLLARLRVWFYEHLEPLAPARLQQYRSGDLLSRIRADIDALDNFYLRILSPAIVALLGTLALVFFLGRYDAWLALVCLSFLLLAGVMVPLWAQRRGRVPGERTVNLSAELRAATVDGLQGLGELIVFGAAQAQAKRCDDLSRRLTRAQAQLARLSGTAQGALGLATNLAMWCSLWIAVPLVREGRIMPAELAMLVLFTLAAFEAVMPLPLAFQTLGETLAAARRIFAIVDAPPEVRDPETLSPRPDHFGIAFRSVDFTYPGAERPALRDIGFDIPEGGRLAVIGASGAGKSTLLNLLLRFRAPTAGRVLLGGQDLARFRGDDARRHLAVVSQQTHLFNTSIKENLLLANPHASQGQIEQACRVAQIHELIVSQPEAYATWVGETGVRLSGGQARRIAIARALLKDAPILLLDEPTEGLDAPTARDLMASIQELMRERTVLLITHRLTGLEAMDEILVLDEGRIVERGTHRELLAREGRYRRFFCLLSEPARADGVQADTHP